MPPAESARPAGFSSILEGLAYAASRPELIGTYVVDIVALTFAMPMAVFPALAARWGGAGAVGYLYSAMSVGALVVTLFSGWTQERAAARGGGGGRGGALGRGDHGARLRDVAAVWRRVPRARRGRRHGERAFPDDDLERDDPAAACAGAWRGSSNCRT